MAGNGTSEAALVLVIDDDDAARVSISQMLELRSYKVRDFSSARAALVSPALDQADCVVCDVKMPGMDGEDFLGEMGKRGVRTPVLMITGHGDVSMAVRCLKSGAYDFVEKPFESEVLLASIGRAVEKSRLRRETDDLRRRLAASMPEEAGAFGMIGQSGAMQDLYEQIRLAARSAAPVLLTGETGAGKELVARAIHNESPRSNGPFMAVNSGALPGTILESELFGHAKGAFTGADADRDGRLVASSGGTLLLDEVESIPHDVQLRLLRVLEDGLVYPLGRDEPRKVDVRFIAATKLNLKEQVEKGGIREDFYHRIMVLNIRVPPLRERIEDIPFLVSNFMRASAIRNGLKVPELREEHLARMMRYSWPGNVRELRNCVERMVVTSQDGVSGVVHFDDDKASGRLLSLPPSSGRLREEMERVESSTIESTLEETDGNVTETAYRLGISRRALYERMKKYGLDKADYRP